MNIGGDILENFIDINELERHNKKIALYRREEIITVEDMGHSIHQVGHYYQTKNSDSIAQLEDEMMKKLKKIIQIHNEHILMIEKVKKEYLETEKQVSKIFKNIDTK